MASLESPIVLPVRPKPVSGESAMGYLMRVASANGRTSVRQLQSIAHNPEVPAFDRLADLLRLTAADKAALFGVLPRSWGLAKLPLGLSRSDFNHTWRRWCPVCLMGSGIFQGAWELKLVCICRHHGIWLHNTCPTCGAYQGWRGTKLLYCDCGATLGRGAVQEAPLPVMRLTEALLSKSGSAIPFQSTSQLEVPAVHRLVRYLGLFSSSGGPKHPGQVAGLHHLSVARKLVTGAADLLENWPAQFHTVLAAMKCTTTISPSIRTTFWPLYRVLYEDLSEPCFQFLRDGFESYLNEHWWGMVCRRNRLMKSKTVELHPRVTLEEAASRSETRPAVLRHLIQAQIIPNERVALNSGKQMTTLHQRTVEGLYELTHGAVTLSCAAKELQLSPSRLRALIACNIIQPLISRQTSSAAAWLISKAELSRLHVPTRRSNGVTGIALRDVLQYWQISEMECAQLVKAVLAGVLTATNQVEQIPVGAALLDRSAVRVFLDQLRLANAGAVSVDRAAKLLGLKQQVVYELVRHGLLKTIEDRVSGHRVMPADIERFRQTYISLADLARTARRSPRSLLCELPVKPVTGPAIDGARQYFFLKVDLQLN